MMSFGGVLGTLTLNLARIGGVVYAQLAEAQRVMAQLAPAVKALSNTAVNGGRWKYTTNKLTKVTPTFSTAEYTPLGPLLRFADSVVMAGDVSMVMDRLRAVARGNDAGWELEQQRAREAAVAGAGAPPPPPGWPPDPGTPSLGNQLPAAPVAAGKLDF